MGKSEGEELEEFLQDDGQVDKLDRKVKRLEAEKAALKRRLKLAHSEIEAAEERLDFALQVQEFDPPAPIKPRRRKSVSESVAVVPWSDWHLGEVVKPETVNNLNEWNPDIARKSVKLLVERTLRQIETQRHGTKIDDLVLWLGGDFMGNYIHPELEESNAMSPNEEILFCMEELTRAIDFLLDHGNFKRIIVPTSHGNHGRCHDDATELLTREGWKTWNRLRVGEEVATYNMETGRAEWQATTDVYINPDYDGEMVKVKTSTADWMVTPNHRMVVCTARKRGITEMGDLSAENIGGQFMPRVGEGSVDDLAGVSDDELRLIGWMVTDGCYARRSDRPEKVCSMTLYQSKPERVEEIRALLGRLGLGHKEHVRHRPAPVILGKQVKEALPEHMFSLHFKQGGYRLLELLPDKHELPGWMFDLSARQVGVFMEAVIAGNGTSSPGRSGKYIEVHGRKEQLDQMQALCSVNGISTRVCTNCRGDHYLSVRSTKRAYLNSNRWGQNVQRVPYKGVVWCATVSNGTLITRRNGMTLVSGNSTDKRRVSTGAVNNYEWLIYQLLARQYRRERKIHFQIAGGALNYLDIFNTRVRFHHGDDVRYYGGVGGLSIPLRKATDAWGHENKADLTVIGHYHQWQDFGFAIVNGSLKGYDAYAQSVKARFEPPRQGLFLINKEYGKTVTMPIYVR